MRKLCRMNQNSIVFGVCAGLAYYLGIQTFWVRFLFLISLFLSGTGFIIYLVLAVCLNKNIIDPDDYQKITS